MSDTSEEGTFDDFLSSGSEYMPDYEVKKRLFPEIGEPSSSANKNVQNLIPEDHRSIVKNYQKDNNTYCDDNRIVNYTDSETSESSSDKTPMKEKAKYRTRKRNRNISLRKSNQRKEKYQKRQSYINSKGDLKPAKKIDEKKQIRPLSVSLYRHIFNYEYNLDFLKPKSDRCDFCEEYKIAQRENRMSEELELLNSQHILKKNLMRTEREQDGSPFEVQYKVENHSSQFIKTNVKKEVKTTKGRKEKLTSKELNRMDATFSIEPVKNFKTKSFTNKKIEFLANPADKTHLVKHIKLTPENISNSDVLCSNHFSGYIFMSKTGCGGRTRLILGALPSEFNVAPEEDESKSDDLNHHASVAEKENAELESMQITNSSSNFEEIPLREDLEAIQVPEGVYDNAAIL
ncbi:unnamed protein product [Psylliodes chrysocephalus]|uniref:Uncharacterized protein n=1 Tax=Psylliodes chrysocephalus TaxID=3402493 RepID=A0A9P0CGX6_9CUCU|nr:unnamed protein product [Psylliodes chrysocephala]